MSFSYHLAASGLVLVVWILLFPLFSWSRKVPGPFIAKRSRLWYLWRLFRRDFHAVNQALHRECGPIVEVMPSYFSIDNPDIHKDIYGYNQPWIKGEFYDAWHVGPGLTNLFSERNPQKHAVMRRKVSSMYSMTSLTSYEPCVDLCIGLICRHLDSFAAAGSDFDLAFWTRCYAFDSIYMITFGKRLGFLDEGKDIANLIQRLDQTRRLHTYLSVYPWLMPVAFLWRRITAGNQQLYHQRFASLAIQRLRHEVEAQSEAVDDGPTCVVKQLLRAQRMYKDNGRSISDWDISMTAGVNVGAGSETTATQLAYTIFLVYQHPHVLQKLRTEIDAVNLPQIPAFAAVQQLPYLQAIVNEALRIFPATGLPLWRQVPEQGIELAGQVFPAGTNLGINAWVANFNPTAYGDDVDTFRPERWIDAKSSRTRTYREENFVTFGCGTRSCIGKNISLLEILKILPVLVRNYDFKFFNPDGTRNVDVSMKGLTTHFVKPEYLRARCTRRDDGLLGTSLDGNSQ